MRRAERGVALLEVLAATAILGVAGLALVDLTDEALRATAAAAAREHEQGNEDRLLTAYTLLLRTDLDLRLGDREVGPYVVHVSRPEPPLYRVAISPRDTPEQEELVTVLYRPEAPRVP